MIKVSSLSWDGSMALQLLSRDLGLRGKIQSVPCKACFGLKSIEVSCMMILRHASSIERSRQAVFRWLFVTAGTSNSSTSMSMYKVKLTDTHSRLM